MYEEEMARVGTKSFIESLQENVRELIQQLTYKEMEITTLQVKIEDAEREKKEAFWAGRTFIDLKPSQRVLEAEWKYKDYESYSLKKGEEETERGG